MHVAVFAVVFICLGSVVSARPEPQSVDSGTTDDIKLGRRYAESTIASDISKIMDSMVQKNFVNFLLNQKEKKSEPSVLAEDPDHGVFNDLLKKEFMVWVHGKGDGFKN